LHGWLRYHCAVAYLRIRTPVLCSKALKSSHELLIVYTLLLQPYVGFYLFCLPRHCKRSTHSTDCFFILISSYFILLRHLFTFWYVTRYQGPYTLTQSVAHIAILHETRPVFSNKSARPLAICCSSSSSTESKLATQGQRKHQPAPARRSKVVPSRGGIPCVVSKNVHPVGHVNFKPVRAKKRTPPTQSTF
jgi:hypothetical protein